LALEYATAVLAAGDAAALSAALNSTLTDMAASPDASLAAIRAMTPTQRQRLLANGAAPAADTSPGLWDLFYAAARRHPDATAVRESPGRTLTYRQLLGAVERQSARLAAARAAA